MQYKTYKNSFIYTWNIDLLCAHIVIIILDKLLEELSSAWQYSTSFGGIW